VAEFARMPRGRPDAARSPGCRAFARIRRVRPDSARSPGFGAAAGIRRVRRDSARSPGFGAFAGIRRVRRDSARSPECRAFARIRRGSGSAQSPATPATTQAPSMSRQEARHGADGHGSTVDKKTAAMRARFGAPGLVADIGRISGVRSGPRPLASRRSASAARHVAPLEARAWLSTGISRCRRSRLRR